MLLHRILLLICTTVLSMGYPLTENVTGIHTAEDLAAFIPVDSQLLEMYVNITRKSIQALGGKEGIRNLGEAIDEYFQFWIDADIRNLPVEDYQKEALRETFSNSSQVLSGVKGKYQHLFPVLSVLKIAGMFNDEVLDAVLESSHFNELCKGTRLRKKMLQLLGKTSRLKKWKKYYHLLFSIANELLDKNWLGMAEIAELQQISCWPEVKDILMDMIKLSETVEVMEESFYVSMKRGIGIDIRDKETLDVKLETFVCQLEGVKSVSDLANLHLSSEERFRKLHTMLKKKWDEIGGMDRIRTVTTALDNLFQLAIDIDFPNQIPVRSMGRDDLADRLMDVMEVIHLAFDVFNGTTPYPAEEQAKIEAKIETVADWLVEPPDLETLQTGIRSWKKKSFLIPIWKKFLQLVVELLEKLHSHGLLDLE